jgi:hypothetical protein
MRSLCLDAAEARCRPYGCEKAARVNAVEPPCQSLETVRLFLGDARDAVFFTQPMHDLLVESLPRKHVGWINRLCSRGAIRMG